MSENLGRFSHHPDPALERDTIKVDSIKADRLDWTQIQVGDAQRQPTLKLDWQDVPKQARSAITPHGVIKGDRILSAYDVVMVASADGPPVTVHVIAEVWRGKRGKLRMRVITTAQTIKK